MSYLLGKMMLLKRFCILILLFAIISCDKDDLPEPEHVEQEEFVIPSFAVLGDNLVTGATGNVVTWTDSYEMASTLNLQEMLGFDFGILKNTIGSEIAIGVGFPTSEFIFYDVATETVRSFDNYFIAENPVGNTFAINSETSLLTYYLDDSSSCCNIYLNTYSQTQATSTEVYLGNANIAPVQLNILSSGDKTFAVAIDTFTNVKKLYVHNTITGQSVGVWDVDQYGGFIYNDIRDELYLFDFTGESLNHVTLEFETLSITEPTSFPNGFELSDGFNKAEFSQDTMVFKNLNGIISNTYNFDTDTIVSYNSTNLINLIFEETGRGITINNTTIDIATGAYLIMGIFLENGLSQGIVVVITPTYEVVLVAESGDISPKEVIFLN